MQTQDVSSRHDLLAQRQRRPPRKQQVTPLSHSDAISHICGSFPLFQAFYIMLQNQSFSSLMQEHQQDCGMMSPQYCACAPDLVFDIMSLSNHFCYSQQQSTATDFGHSSLPVESHYSSQRKSMSQHVSAKGRNNMSLVGFVFQFQLLFSLSFILFYYLFLLFAHSSKHNSLIVGYFLQTCIADL